VTTPRPRPAATRFSASWLTLRVAVDESAQPPCSAATPSSAATATRRRSRVQIRIPASSAEARRWTSTQPRCGRIYDRCSASTLHHLRRSPWIGSRGSRGPLAARSCGIEALHSARRTFRTRAGRRRPMARRPRPDRPPGPGALGGASPARSSKGAVHRPPQPRRSPWIGSTTSRNPKRWKSRSRVTMRLTPCSRMRTTVWRS
jgi:hypothetical protein